jgi:hypothetical protein
MSDNFEDIDKCLYNTDDYDNTIFSILSSATDSRNIDIVKYLSDKSDNLVNLTVERYIQNLQEKQKYYDIIELLCNCNMANNKDDTLKKCEYASRQLIRYLEKSELIDYDYKLLDLFIVKYNISLWNIFYYSIFWYCPNALDKILERYRYEIDDDLIKKWVKDAVNMLFIYGTREKVYNIKTILQKYNIFIRT